jgi:hypothetical protein
LICENIRQNNCRAIELIAPPPVTMAGAKFVQDAFWGSPRRCDEIAHSTERPPDKTKMPPVTPQVKFDVASGMSLSNTRNSTLWEMDRPNTVKEHKSKFNDKQKKSYP